MSGSNSGMFLNETTGGNTTISFCKSINLSADGLAIVDNNLTFWSIGENKQVGALVVGILILLFFFIASIWNMFIIITFFIKHQLLREPANIFLLNLAFIDLLICFTTMVFSFVTAFAQEFIFGSSDAVRCIMCNTSGFFLVYLIFVSLHLLMALSIDRFILLSRPLRYKRLMNRWKAIIICVVIYVVCFGLSVLPQIGLGEIEFNARFAACVPRFTPMRNFYWVILLAVEALIPIFVLAFTNVWTYRLVSKFLKKNFRRKSTYRKRDSEGRSSQNKEEQKHQSQQKQLIKVFSALLVSNIIAYTPTILSIVAFIFIGTLIPSEVYILGFVSFLTNPVFHPIIESFFVKELRYQVNRAKHGVRRVSTSIYRGTTQLFNQKTLDEANKKMEDGTDGESTRSIRFLNGKMTNTTRSSMSTEMEDFTTNSSSSASPTRQLEEGGGDGGGGNDNSNPPAASIHPEPKGFNKSRRSVTFRDSNTDEETLPPGKSPGASSSHKEKTFTLQEFPREETIAEVSGTLEREGASLSSYAHNANNANNNSCSNYEANESDTTPTT